MPKIKIVWSNEAKADLKYIYKRILFKTRSKVNANNVKQDLLKASKQIEFVEQYQVDEILGEPFRRIPIRHFKLVYYVENKTSIIILEVFDSYRSPDNIRNVE